jgi:aryl-alcohol dehydrogenase-like predicted oxidoreductase
MGGKAVRLLDAAFDAGVNFYDIGSNAYYRGSERAFAPFLAAHRGDIWVTSKAPLRPINGYEPGKQLTVEQGKFLADYWSGLLDASLADLGTDYVDAYYLMGVGEPAIVRCEALHEAFLKAKKAGKVGHWGVSTHKNAPQVLEAVIETDWYDLAMIAITPAGWYDWDSKCLLPGTPAMLELQPTLKRARDAGIGLVGMKAARYLSSRGGAGTENAFDGHYSDTFMQSGLSPWQRSYAFVLAHGVDVVNSDMQNFAHFKENLAAVQRSSELFVRA